MNPSTQNDKNMGAGLGNSPRELHQTTTLSFGFSSRENHPFSHQNPIFDPIDPKFDPKTYTLDYKHKKNIQNHNKHRIKTLIHLKIII